MVSVGMLFAFFYIVVVSWSMWYLFASFSLSLNWATCDHDYNSPHCVPLDGAHGLGLGNVTYTAESVSAVEEYWKRFVLDEDGKSWDNYVSLNNFPFM